MEAERLEGGESHLRARRRRPDEPTLQLTAPQKTVLPAIAVEAEGRHRLVAVVGTRLRCHRWPYKSSGSPS